jgi:hypothetical protein
MIARDVTERGTMGDDRDLGNAETVVLNAHEAPFFPAAAREFRAVAGLSVRMGQVVGARPSRALVASIFCACVSGRTDRKDRCLGCLVVVVIPFFPILVVAPLPPIESEGAPFGKVDP